MDLTSIENLFLARGFSQFGSCRLQKSHWSEAYDSWLQSNYQGDMSYMKSHRNAKLDPQTHWPDFKTVFVGSYVYVDHPESFDEFPLQESQIARYARGRDYHHWLKEKLNSIVEELQKAFPEEHFLCVTDSTPLMEREVAYRSGIGWLGKNTCIIHPKQGSFFLLGEILTSLEVPKIQSEPHPDHCGTCTRCLDVCPTDAFVEPRVLDASKCISYLTIESPGEFPKDLRAGVGKWLFGCDLCQTVCPWNKKIYDLDEKQEMNLDVSKPEMEELRWVLESSNRELQKSLRGTPLMRAAGNKLRRNALVVIGNAKIKSLRELVASYLNHHKLGDTAQWALEQLEGE